MLLPHKIKLVPMHTETNSPFLDFEMSESSAPYYQTVLGNRLCYEIMFSDYNRVINSSKTDATHKITDISLEYETVTQSTLARSIKAGYSEMVLYYNRILRQTN